MPLEENHVCGGDGTVVNLSDFFDIKVLSLRPEDEIIIRYPGKLSDHVKRSLACSAGVRWPGHRVTVLDSGLAIEIVRPLPTTPPPKDAVVDLDLPPRSNRGYEFL